MDEATAKAIDESVEDLAVSHSVCSIFDAKAEAFGTPIFVKANGLAIREFQKLVNGQDPNFSSFPEDFTLYQIGEFDEKSSEIRSFIPPRRLCNGVDVFAPVDSQGV